LPYPCPLPPIPPCLRLSSLTPGQLDRFPRIQKFKADVKQHGPDLSVCLGVQPCGQKTDMQLTLGLKGLESAVSIKVGRQLQALGPHLKAEPAGAKPCTAVRQGIRGFIAQPAWPGVVSYVACMETG